jgi:hypothetical protein
VRRKEASALSHSIDLYDFPSFAVDGASVARTPPLMMTTLPLGPKSGQFFGAGSPLRHKSP